MKKISVLLMICAMSMSASLARADEQCLDQAKDWIYQNTSANSSESAGKALEFCAHGEVSCLSTTKDYIYKNTSANSSESAAKALTMCAGGDRDLTHF